MYRYYYVVLCIIIMDIDYFMLCFLNDSKASHCIVLAKMSQMIILDFISMVISEHLDDSSVSNALVTYYVVFICRFSLVLRPQIKWG